MRKQPDDPNVSESRLRGYLETVPTFQQAGARAAGWLLRLSLSANLLQALLLGLAIAAILMITPTIRLVPVIIYARDDGTFESAFSPEGLPPDLNKTAQLQVVWQFVRSFESYSDVESEGFWNVVSALSSQPVRDQYRRDHDARNPESPIRKYGDQLIVHVELLSMAPACESCETRYNVRFERTVKRKSDPRVERSVWVATVAWTMGQANRVTFHDRMTLDVPGLVVTDYPGAQQETLSSPRADAAP